MSNWYVKELSQLTGVSVQTLHHYDRIGLLKPSLRLPNGYRVYHQNDLLRLQQIIALKFFGFELSYIKQLLASETDAFAHFSAQIECLEAKAKTLLDASTLLKQMIQDKRDETTIPWESIIKVIEVYRMSEQLEHNWVKEIFTAEELKQYAHFESEWKKIQRLSKKQHLKKNWSNLVAEIQANLVVDPTSSVGIHVGEKCMLLINAVYGKKYAHLRTKKFEEGFAKGKGLNEVGLTPEMVAWLDKAIDAYWHDRLYGILGQVGTGVADDTIFNLWNETLDDMYGDDAEGKKALYELALSDANVSEEAKIWLKTLKDLVRANSHLQ